MLSPHQRFWNFYARFVQKPVLAIVTYQPLARQIYNLNAFLTLKTPRGLQLTQRMLQHGDDQVSTTRCQISLSPSGGTMLYLHGGAFTIGNLRGYKHLVAALGKGANQNAYFLHYGLAPEPPFPKALDQATAAYQALCADPQAGPISIVGDSAGGNLAFALLHRICSRDLPRPAAVVGLSPAVDLRAPASSFKTNAKSDHLVPVSWARRGMAAYLRGHDPADPDVSPVLGRFEGAPPCLVHVDETEVLYDDGCAMAAALRAQGVAVDLVRTRGRTHVWHLNVGRAPEADASVHDIGAFIQRATSENSP